MHHILIGKILDYDHYQIIFKSKFGIHKIEISFHLLQAIKSSLNKKIKIYVQIFLQKWNDNLYYQRIYGFSSNIEKEIFLILLGISGIGVKKAIHILQENAYQQILIFVFNKDDTQFATLKGIGKKASQWSLLLYPKFKKLQKIYPNLLNFKNTNEEKKFNLETQLIQSLENFGYKNIEIQNILKKIRLEKDIPQDIESLLKKALRLLKP